jgi:hypothetical protein
VVLAVNAQQAELLDLGSAGEIELLHHKFKDVLPSSAFSVRLRSFCSNGSPAFAGAASL